MLRVRYLAAALCGVTLAGPAGAQNADPVVKPEYGDWMIFVKAYSGPPGRPLAFELINEIRTKYKLPAYYFNKGAEERDRERERVRKLEEELTARQAAFAQQIGLPLDMPHRGVRTVRIEEQYAVVVGGWETAEEARKALDGIRKLPPPDDRFMDGWVPPEEMQAGRNEPLKPRLINPFQTSFVVPNPAKKQQQDDPLNKVDDPVVRRLNTGIDHSVLDCPKAWTLMVKVYHAPAVVQAAGSSDSPLLAKLGMSTENSYLTECAKQAHSLAGLLNNPLLSRSLRLPRVNAYVMHTQYSSIVTVGEFDRPDDPALLQLQRQLAGLQLRQTDEQGQSVGPALETLTEQPLPMPVPFKKR